MKKKKIIIDFFIGGSIFIISTIFATFISLLFMGQGIETIIGFKGIEYIALFILGGTIFTIMKYLFEHVTNKPKGKEVVLKTQLYIWSLEGDWGIFCWLILLYPFFDLIFGF